MIESAACPHCEGVRFQTRYLAAGLDTSIEPEPRLSKPGLDTSAVPGMTRSHARVRNAVQRHLGLVWRVARRAGLGPQDAEDASQQAFLILSQRLHAVPPRAEASFLVSIVLRVASDLRNLKWNTCVERGLDVETQAASAAPLDEALDRRRAHTLLLEMLDRLDEPERLAFVLVEIEQMSRSEAARSLRIPEGTVASRLRKARALLEAGFAKAFGGEEDEA